MKIRAIAHRHGLSLSVSTHAANHHEVRSVQLCFDFYMIDAKPDDLIGDRGHHTDPLDDDLRKDSIESPHDKGPRACKYVTAKAHTLACRDQGAFRDR